ncbi:type VI secretion system baseplate subunit TssF [Sediminicola luteus]|uniref:Type VI secretion system baseplate subunit TssF n=1 Tax=Sediminicola luteus TaxID=319238 RepID=A0ABV2TYH0_9FLAO
MQESKDKIKNRMIRNAAKVWGFPEPQSESSFDPLVSLLLGSCAFELEKISKEINNSESRIIERLINILTPQPITSPHPAYAIAYAKPSKKSAKVLPGFQFYADIKVSNQSEIKTKEKQIFFSPTGTFGLTDGRVRYLAGHKRMYEYVEDQYKDIVTEKFKSPLPPTSIFIGLELNEKQRNITLFFDLISDHLKQFFFDGLEACNWKMGNVYVDAEKGLSDLGKRDHDVYQMIDREHDLSSKIASHVNRFFDRQFVTLKLQGIEETVDMEHTKLPEALATSIDENELSNLSETITWIEVQFTTPISDELLENLSCSLNCFPIINRKQNEFTGSTRELINIIPLQTEDVFFDLESVTNANEESYKIRYFESQANISKGSALLRLDGVGRFDSRRAMEYLEYLLELMKEESAAFNVIGSDMISSNLKELNQAIARLEKKIEDVQLEKGDTAYLMLKPQDGDRQVFVEFWSTSCSSANNIRMGTMLKVYKGDDLDYNATRLITTTTGGKEKPNTEERINTCRRSLQSGERVVTREDIKALCYEHFSDTIAGVKIEKGIKKGTTKSEGFVRTIDTHVQLKKGLVMSPTEQNTFRQKLVVLLETRSTNMFPYRVFFDD